MYTKKDVLVKWSLFRTESRKELSERLLDPIAFGSSISHFTGVLLEFLNVLFRLSPLILICKNYLPDQLGL